jgi:pimeloyl-ACP methyl ester carboxylesterase
VTDRVSQRGVSSVGHRIHVRQAGAGPLVLMLHGFPETSYSYRHQLAALAAAGYHAVAIDMLGYGRSSKPTAVHAYRITELVNVAAGVVEALGETTAVVVGHDWGAPAAWACAWTRPDVFEAVLGASVPFGGRHLMPWPGCTSSSARPSELRRIVAGPGRITYQDYFARPGVLAGAADRDVRGYLRGVFHRISAAGGAPTWDSLTSTEDVMAFLHASPLILGADEEFRAGAEVPEELPTWLSEDDFEVFVAEFEYTGIEYALNRYRLSDLDWELLEPYEGRPLEVPALYVGGDRDVSTLWGREAILQMNELAPYARDPVLIEDCGHWVQQEKPHDFNLALLDFLGVVKPV